MTGNRLREGEVTRCRLGLEPWAAAVRTKSQQQRFPMLGFAVVAAVIKRNHTRNQIFVRI